MPARDSQAGFTLVELMIALLVSLILLAGVLNIMLSNRQSLRAQNALADLQSRANLLNTVVDNSVAAAGYHVDPDDFADDVFPKRAGDAYGGALAAGAVVSGKDAGPNQKLRIRFEAAGALHDCAGNQIGGGSAPATGEQSSDFSLRVNDDDDLQCHTYKTDAVAKQTEALVSRVGRFKVFYGLRPSAADKGSVSRYVETLAPTQQRRVVSLRVQALLYTKARILSQSLARTFDFADGESLDVDNRRAYLLLDRTVALPNNLP